MNVKKWLNLKIWIRLKPHPFRWVQLEGAKGGNLSPCHNASCSLTHWQPSWCFHCNCGRLGSFSDNLVNNIWSFLLCVVCFGGSFTSSKQTETKKPSITGAEKQPSGFIAVVKWHQTYFLFAEFQLTELSLLNAGDWSANLAVGSALQVKS